MTSIVKKVLRSSGKKKKIHLHLEHQKNAPQDPPSPDLSSLKPYEVAILRDVLKRQEEFESEETSRRQRLHDCLVSYEDEVKKQANQKTKLRTVDVRVCRLCFKTKFPDGLGKACYDCHERVCNACGAFSMPSWNAKKQKNVKGKWRCVMCEMKRDVVAMTGEWHPGNRIPVKPTSKFKTKLSVSEMDSSETDDRTRFHLVSSPEKEIKESTESDVFCEVDDEATSYKPNKRAQKYIYRRRSSAPLECDFDEDIDVEEFHRERQMSRIRRQSKRSRRRFLSGSSATSATENQSTEMSVEKSDSDVNVSDNKQSKYSSQHSLREKIHHHTKRGPLQKTKRVPSVLSLQEYPTSDRHISRHEHSLKESRKHIHHTSIDSNVGKQRPHKRTLRGQCSLQTSPGREFTSRTPSIKISKNTSDENDASLYHKQCQSLNEDDLLNASDSCVQVSDSNRNVQSDSSPVFQSRSVHHSLKLKGQRSLDQGERCRKSKTRPRDTYTSRDSSDTSPTSPSMAEFHSKIERQRECYHSSSSSVFSDSKQGWSEEFSRSEHSVTSPQRKPEPVDISNERKFTTHRSFTKGLTPKRLSSNSLSPDMALFRSQKREEKRNRFIHQVRSGSVSPRMGIRSEEAENIRDNYNRRMTLPSGLDIEYNTSTGDKYLSRARRVILHRNENDNSMRTRGLGMRVVGGKRRHDGNLGSFVSMVTKGSPADKQGILEGDEIVEWNGESLVNATFEQAHGIMNKEPKNIVQLSVVNTPNKGSVSSLTRECPIIIRSAETSDNRLTGGRSRRLHRRMLPKTPIEIKRDVRRICGKVWLKLEYNTKCNWLMVELIRGEDIMADSSREPNVAAMLHVLPHRSLHESKESDVKPQTREPQWNETFVFSNISPSDIQTLSLEVTLWDFKEPYDEFLGEILLDLSEAKLDKSLNCYHLEDHDENSSPLPFRQKSFSLSDSATSPVSVGTSSYYPSREPSPRSSVSQTKDGASCASGVSGRLSTTLVHEKMNELHAKLSRDRIDFSSSAHSSPLHSPGYLEGWRTDSGSLGRLEILLPPHPLNSSNTSISFFDDIDSLKGNSLDRPAPEGNEITSMLGPAQIPPRPLHEKGVCGDMKMGFMVSKGQLEIDIVVAKGLQKHSTQQPPDTYVKTYLMEGDKVVQKKKTQIVRMSFDPIFRKTIKYSACNIHGRYIRVNVWDKQKTFDKKQSLGEILVKLDNLDLSQHTMAWYKLFPVGAAEVGSDDNESLNYWPIT
ncbi:FYVE-type zinc finger [Mactra antiquata]